MRCLFLFLVLLNFESTYSQDLVLNDYSNHIIISDSTLTGISLSGSKNVKIKIQNSTLTSVYIANSQVEQLEIVNSKINSVSIWDNTFSNPMIISNDSIFESLIINNNTLAQDAKTIKRTHTISGNELFQVEIKQNELGFKIDNNVFRDKKLFDCENSPEFDFETHFSYFPQFKFTSFGTEYELLLRGNKFLNDTLVNSINFCGIYGAFLELEILNNKFDGVLDLYDVEVQKLKVTGNQLNYMSLEDLRFSETLNLIPWDQLDGNRLCLTRFTDDYCNLSDGFEFGGEFVDPTNIDEQAAQRDGYLQLYGCRNVKEASSYYYFELLVSTYQKLYEIYKSRGDLESANGVYVEMKNLQTLRYEALFLNHKSFRNFFRWKLYQLLKVYTQHGTDPALAITITFYVIFGFAFLYLFFPSDWDDGATEVRETKRSQKILAGIHRIINSLALSLNAFVTLGFGKIPTRGLAKYLAILEGFIGWFLLSIFSVALINQVLT
ncbi:hypothetical protein SAMN04488029_0959 [Reichenbachiella faecimaris]|uniref:Ion channel n=1 Tax=Reichenbachiella faecimaris TaxID=692418 RepID=A0A1W2G7F2_REIFA|nr:hypothetical protein [Reichenbachiella faecimaris]SMD32610.1 hypothetical protein SAMN04488029_0959 [Reichenbachiella faecimaris]